MSWNFIAYGKPEALLKKVEHDFALMMQCAEPEQSIRDNIVTIINMSLKASPSAIAIKIEASGSQYTNDGKQINSFNVTVTPLYGFVE